MILCKDPSIQVAILLQYLYLHLLISATYDIYVTVNS